jgi:hypothetical protein
MAEVVNQASDLQLQVVGPLSLEDGGALEAVIEDPHTHGTCLVRTVASTIRSFDAVPRTLEQFEKLVDTPERRRLVGGCDGHRSVLLWAGSSGR